MGRQTKILRNIIDCFINLHEKTLQNKNAQIFNKSLIKIYYKKSLNKHDLVRRILNDVVLSNDEIIELLRIIFNEDKKK
jgi:nitric oxide reductase activation protein